MVAAHDIDEAELVASAKAGSRRAFDRLIERHAPRLLALAARTLGNGPDAEDAVQNALASAWLALGRFDERKPLGPWLTTIALNKCRDALRRRRLGRLFGRNGDEDVPLVVDESPNQGREVAGRQFLGEVQQEISRLPTKLREPFVLVTFDGCSHAEAGGILGISEKAVESRLYRARRQLKEKFADR